MPGIHQIGSVLTTTDFTIRKSNIREVSSLKQLLSPLTPFIPSFEHRRGLRHHNRDLSSFDVRVGDHSSLNIKQCRFCFTDDETHDNPLIAPCKCSGSLHFIHVMCLKTWLARNQNVVHSANRKVTTYSYRTFHCELCKSRIKEKIVNPMDNQNYVSLVDLFRPKQNYIILESYIADYGGILPKQPDSISWQKNVHVLNFDQTTS